MIIPALLTTNPRIAQDRIDAAKHMSGWLHIDLLDNSLYKYESLSLAELKQLEFGELEVEVHCMTDDPVMVAKSKLPVQRIILHYELPMWDHHYMMLTHMGIDTWLAIEPSTNVHKLDLPEDLSGIVLMGVEPGQSGQSLVASTFDRIDSIKDYYPDVPITIDGGVNKTTIHKLVAHGADNLVMGSALFSTHEPIQTYDACVRLSEPVGGLHDR